MLLRNKLAIAMVAFLAPMVFASTASAQIGVGCTTGGGILANSCGLGGQIRGQIGDGLPLPITFAPANYGADTGFKDALNVFVNVPATAGPFAGFTMLTPNDHLPSQLDWVGNGLGQAGQIKPTNIATIMQGDTAPRSLRLAPGVFNYHGQPEASVGVVGFNAAVFAVKTNVSFDSPHPGTTPMGGAPAFTFDGGVIPTPAANLFEASGRVGASIVSFYQGASSSGNPSNNWSNTGGTFTTITPMDGTGGPAFPEINGVARFSRTSNQFGGQSIGRANGTAKVYFVVDGVPPLPCKVVAGPLEGTNDQPGDNAAFHAFNTGTACKFALSIVNLEGSNATVAVVGGKFGGRADGSAFVTATGIFTGTIGFNGTIIGTGNPVTELGVNLPFAGQGNQAIGFPATTGMLTVHVDAVVGATAERFVRTGIDARDADGNGVVALVTGSMTARDISLGNSNPTWITLEIPEPSAIMAASAGLLALFGCHQIVRRRS